MTAAGRRSVVVVLGTRPEAIKLAPVLRELGARSDEIETRIVATGQHRELVDRILDDFGIAPDVDLEIMRHDQEPAAVLAAAIGGLDETLRDLAPDLVVVQGDTTSALAAALAAFYRGIAVGHVEAGLRTGDSRNPFPEEINRRMIATVADRCWAPTETARAALLAEGVAPDRVLVTGNTVVDALLAASARVEGAGAAFDDPALRALDAWNERVILVTLHRRESFGPALTETCQALRELLARRSDVRLVVPVHPNPRVREIVVSVLGRAEGALLTEPAGYLDFVRLMRRAHLIATDSGGVQEEAPSLDTPVLVLRERTERPEGVATGASRLVGTSRQAVLEAITSLLDDAELHARMAAASNPYGDGRAAHRVVESARHILGLREGTPAPFTADGADAGKP